MQSPHGAAAAGGKRYLLVWLLLVLLTFGSFGMSRLQLGQWAFAAALTIAAAKASLVLVVFMHLDREHFTARFVAVLNVLWVLLLCAGIGLDVLTR